MGIRFHQKDKDGVSNPYQVLSKKYPFNIDKQHNEKQFIFMALEKDNSMKLKEVVSHSFNHIKLTDLNTYSSSIDLFLSIFTPSPAINLPKEQISSVRNFILLVNNYCLFLYFVLKGKLKIIHNCIPLDLKFLVPSLRVLWSCPSSSSP